MILFYRVLYWVAYRALRSYWFVFRPVGPSVHVAIWHEGRILLIRNPYKPFVCVPAGGLHRREAPAEAAARELREEVGIDVCGTDLNSVGIIESRQEYKKDVAHFFEKTLLDPPTLEIDTREVSWARFRTVDEALQEPLSDVVRQYLAARQS